jgi:hypothetical protein
VDWLLLVLRLTHVVLGALWVGMIALNIAFLMPAVRAAGPGGGAVMAELQRRKLMTVIPAIALGTILSGIWLMQRVWGGMAGLMASRPGQTLAAGAVASIVAFFLGVGVMRPLMLRAATMAQGMGAVASDEERAVRAKELERVRARATTVGQLVALLVLFATAAMAVARYV